MDYREDGFTASPEGSPIRSFDAMVQDLYEDVSSASNDTHDTVILDSGVPISPVSAFIDDSANDGSEIHIPGFVTDEKDDDSEGSLAEFYYSLKG